MRRLRYVPWLLAIAGLVGLFNQLSTQSPEWLWLVAVWAALLAGVWLLGRAIKTTRDQRMAVALGILIVLIPLSWWGGFWLIPADLAWLAIVAIDRDAEERIPGPIAQ